MLNQNHNVHKRTNSKILLVFICIFGLLFSWSCSCKNNVTGPGNDGLEDGRDTNTINSQEFSASVSGTVQDTLRVNSLNKKKDGTKDIKISFSALKGVTKVENFAVTIEKVEVKDGGLNLGDSPETYKNYMRYDKDSGTLIFENQGLQAIGGLDSKDNFVDKTVSITFKIDGGEQGSDYITRDFHLIKIKKIEEDDMQGILQKMDYSDSYDIGEYDDKKGSTFVLSGGKWNKIQGEYVIKNTSTAKTLLDKFDEGAINKYKGSASYYLKKLS